MARRIMAGVVLALVCLAIGHTVEFGQDADATVTYDGFRNIGNWGDCITDTTGATTADSVVIHCSKVYKWSIKAYGSYDVIYKFKNAGIDSISGAGYVESLAAGPDAWEVAPEWIKVKSADAGNAARYVITVQGYHDGTVGAHVIADTTAGGQAVTWP